MSKKQMGFTLIEIVMVLVLLGILSAVAVPKYFDLRDKAEEKAVAALAAEVQARLNGSFANELLNNNKDCASARTTALGEAVLAVSGDAAKSVTDLYTVDAKALSGATKGGSYAVIFTSKGGSKTPYTHQIAVPTCSNDK